jgi:secondary thiamine-phosphate synthase enzyme
MFTSTMSTPVGTHGERNVMMIHRGELTIATTGRGTHDITREVTQIVRASGARVGLATIFIHHTSASLIICENADPSVRADLEAFAARLVRDGDPLFTHDAEGDDDMPAHVRTVLTQTSIGVPVVDGRLALGTWQGVYLWEHRTAPHRRHVSVTVIGE